MGLGLGLETCGLGLDLAHPDLRLGLDTSGLELGYFYLNENTLISEVFLIFVYRRNIRLWKL